MDNPEVVPQLIDALADDDVWVRYFSARALGRRRSKNSIDALESLVQQEKFNHVRIAALDSLGQIGESVADLENRERVAGIVRELVTDEDPDVAHAAEAALAKSGQRE